MLRVVKIIASLEGHIIVVALLGYIGAHSTLILAIQKISKFLDLTSLPFFPRYSIAGDILQPFNSVPDIYNKRKLSGLKLRK